MLKWVAATIILLAVWSSLSAQSKINSLNLELESATTDSAKINILSKLYFEYRYDAPPKAKEVAIKAIELSEQSNNAGLQIKSYVQYADFLYSQSSYDSARLTYQKGLELAEKTGSTHGQSAALIGLGNCYLKTGSFEKAIEYHEQNIELCQNINDHEGMASSYNNMGNIYLEIADYTKAMEFFTLSSKKYYEQGNLRDYSITLANIGVIQRMLQNYESAKGYFISSDSIAKKLDDQPGRAFALKNLAIIYKNTGELDEAMAYNTEALKSYERMGDRKKLAEVYYNMGNIYWAQEDFREAIKTFQKSREISELAGDSIFVAYSFSAIGQAYLQLHENENAENFLLKGLTIARHHNLDLIAMDSYENLAINYAEGGDFKKAYESTNQYNILRDSLYTREKRGFAEEIEAKYQNEQKVKEIALLESENNFQTLQIQKRENERNYLIAFTIVVLLLAGLIYNQYRIKQKANNKLKELDHLKSDFLANVSHEFRTPLSLIMAPLKEKVDQSKSGKEREEFKMMYRNADRLFNLIDQLLDLSKLEHSKIKLEKSAVEIGHLFKIIAASFSSLAEHKGINFRIEIPDEGIWLELDQDIVQKACFNLLSNAFKFTQEEGEVAFQVEVDQDILRIIVSDLGSGIPTEDQGKVFDRFFQSSNAGDLGTGIGLALTKELVEFHQGEINLQSDPGQGSIFKIEIPVHEAQTHEEVKVKVDSKILSPDYLSDEELEETNNTAKNPLILIIEDNSDLSDYLGELLHDDYTIHKSQDGEEGIIKAKEIIPDLIISDVMMPKKDGMDVCNDLKKAKETDHIPIILLTARADQESKFRGLATGADDYLLKPFDSAELKVRVSNLLNQRAKLKEKYTKLLLLAPNEINISTAEEGFLKTVMEVVNEHIGDSEFSIEQFCSEMGMSRMQLHRKLTTLTGYSATTFVRHQRLLSAAQLLAQGESVSQVAYAVGFGSLSYFTRAFKEEYGIVPSEYSSTSRQQS